MEMSGPSDTSKNRAVGRSKIRRRVSHSWAMRVRSESMGNGVSGGGLVSHEQIFLEQGVQSDRLLGGFGAYFFGVYPR